MPTTRLTRRWGHGIKNPTTNDLRDALSELNTSDPEHPDCWLADESGWSISVFENGLIVLENVETGEGPWHLNDPSKNPALELWQLLQSGDLESIKDRQWRPGYKDG